MGILDIKFTDNCQNYPEAAVQSVCSHLPPALQGTHYKYSGGFKIRFVLYLYIHVFVYLCICVFACLCRRLCLWEKKPTSTPHSNILYTLFRQASLLYFCILIQASIITVQYPDKHYYCTFVCILHPSIVAVLLYTPSKHHCCGGAKRAQDWQQWQKQLPSNLQVQLCLEYSSSLHKTAQPPLLVYSPESCRSQHCDQSNETGYHELF